MAKRKAQFFVCSTFDFAQDKAWNLCFAAVSNLVGFCGKKNYLKKAGQALHLWLL